MRGGGRNSELDSVAAGLAACNAGLVSWRARQCGRALLAHHGRVPVLCVQRARTSLRAQFRGRSHSSD